MVTEAPWTPALYARLLGRGSLISTLSALGLSDVCHMSQNSVKWVHISSCLRAVRLIETSDPSAQRRGKVEHIPKLQPPEGRQMLTIKDLKPMAQAQ